MANYKIQTDTGEKQENIQQAMQKMRQEEKEREVASRAKEMGMDYVDLKSSPINTDALFLLASERARVARVVVYLQVGRKVRVALEDPENEEAKKILAELRAKDFELSLSLASVESIEHALAIYSEQEVVHVEQITREVDESALESYAAEIEKLKGLKEKLHELTAAELINAILVGGIRTGASDVHFQPEEDRVDLFFRIDGILQKIFSLDERIYKQLRSQVKHDAGVKMNVENVPQDGELSFTVNERRIDVRVSTLPTEFSENLVLRLLDSEKGKVDFDKLGFEEDHLEILKRALNLPYGMILATGPTGSGKTTTLYALLNKLNSPEKKIVTLEDPVEYHLEGVAQAEINEAEGFTFGSGLRAVLRQDPDIIMVGEIRDKDTANSAVQAALTGHTVLSTLHTNSAVEAVPRMLNLDVPEFLLAPATAVIIAQRLVRQVCPHCSLEEAPTELEFEQIEKVLNEMPENLRARMPEIPGKLVHAKGCQECSQTGYKGRSVIAEIVELDDDVRRMIIQKRPVKKSWR